MENKNVSRRNFIKSSVAASAALSIPTIVPSTVFGADAPSNRITVGLIGCGNIGNYHKNTIHKIPGTRILAVCDAYKSRRDAMAAKLNKHYGGSEVTKAYSDFRELIARDDVDTVFIGAHDNWHTPMSIAAAKAGKDIYCQKPLSLDLTRTALLRKVVNEKNLVFQLGTQYRSKPRYRLMIDLVRNGYIGKLEWIDVWSRNVNVYTNTYNGKPYGSETEIPIPDDLDFDAWQGPSPMVPYTSDRTTMWGGYNCPETSLGFLTCAGIHPLGVAQWGNNTDHTSPIRYEGSGNIPTSGIFRTLENWDVMCEYENGVKLRMRDCFSAKEDVKKYYPSVKNNDGVVFFGTEGWIGNFDYSGTFDASNRKIWKQEFKPTDKRIPTVGEGHVKNFIDCVKSRRETTMPVEAAIRLDTTAHMINVAAQTKRVIKWDPKQEKIIGDKEAAKIITRPYRKKWKVW